MTSISSVLSCKLLFDVGDWGDSLPSFCVSLFKCEYWSMPSRARASLYSLSAVSRDAKVSFVNYGVANQMWTVLPTGDGLCWNSGLYCESSGLNRGLINGWKGVWCCVPPPCCCCCKAANWWAKFEFASRFGNKWLKFACRLAAAAACRFRWCTAAECKEGFEKADAGKLGGVLYGFWGDFEDDAINAVTENGFNLSFGVSGRPESDSDLPHRGDSARVTTSDDDVPESADSRRNFSLKSAEVRLSSLTCLEGSSKWHTRLVM